LSNETPVELGEPYTLKNLPDRLKGLPTSAKRAWVKTWNNSYKHYLSKGKSAKDAESLAFATANAQLKKMGWHRSANGKWVKRDSKNQDDLHQLSTAALVALHNALHEDCSQDMDKAADMHQTVVRMLQARGLKHPAWDSLDDSEVA